MKYAERFPWQLGDGLLQPILPSVRRKHVDPKPTERSYSSDVPSVVCRVMKVRINQLSSKLAETDLIARVSSSVTSSSNPVS